MRRILFTAAVCIGILCTAAVVNAETPMDVVKQNVGQVLDVLRNKSLSRDAKTASLEKIYKVMFDETELSKRSLGRNWKRLTPEQQKEFISLFRQVLENAYIDRILSYKDQKVEFLRELKLDDNRSEVQTQVLTSSGPVPIYYRLIREGATWRVYDVIIENVSLVQNYRSQFNSILARETPAQLIETLKKRVKQRQS